MRLAVLLFLFSLIAQTTCFAASVFKVSKGEDYLYVGGTLHLLSESDYPLPTQYSQAYEQSDLVVFETDLAALDSPEFLQHMLSALTYQKGERLTDALSQTTITSLTAHLEKRGLTLQQFNHFKPAMMSMTLSMVELQRMGLTSEGVDKHFHHKASLEGKPIAWLETPEQQIAFIAQMGQGDPDAFMQYTLKDLAQLPELLPELKSSWSSGDLDKMYNESLADFAEQYPKVFDTLITQRNNAWMRDLNHYLASPEVEFVLVGALHLPGNVGVLNQLREQGYEVEKVK
tara:strand:- start:9434 stop:10294 length:861 start_codon:yes stop_codon:yes gene_type:complete